MITKNNQTKKTNPLMGVSIFGLGATLIVALGAIIRDNKVHDEALAVLVGGAINGAIAGLVHSCIPTTNEDSNSCLKFVTAVLDTALPITAFLTAPLMGEQYLGYGSSWGETVLDEIIESASIAGSVELAGATAVVAGCCYNFFSKAPAQVAKFLSNVNQPSKPNTFCTG
ncbi:MAG: hypothetical protein WC627_02735 [Legionella sp.]|jgi:hypothetical protein